MKKRLFLIVLILLVVLLFSVSCKPQVSGGESARETGAITNYVRSGPQGLEADFVQNFPPRTMYDTQDLIILVDLNNRGNYDLRPDRCFVQVGGFDPSIISLNNERQSCGEILGKSVFYTQGGREQLEFESRRLNLPRDVDRFSPTLVATSCYEYQTVASPQVCVDPQFYELTSAQKACQVRDFGLSGGQGAPVAVTFVNVDMVGSKALFEIDIQNVGGGKVISPRASLSRCPTQFKYKDFDEIRFNVQFSNAKLLSCTPSDNLVRLSNDAGKIFCTFDIGNTQAYEAPLRVELNYNYMDSERQTIEIIRTPG